MTPFKMIVAAGLTAAGFGTLASPALAMSADVTVPAVAQDAAAPALDHVQFYGPYGYRCGFPYRCGPRFYGYYGPRYYGGYYGPRFYGRGYYRRF